MPDRPEYESAAEVASKQARLRRFRFMLSFVSSGLAVLAAFLLIRFEILPPGPFGFLAPQENAGPTAPAVEDDALILEEVGSDKTGHKYVYDELLGWRNIPNWQATTFGKTLSINSKGLRDAEHPYAKPDGVKRILVLGDSFAWGYGVADHETFSAVLEELLANRDAPRWEVINTGVSGWSTDQQYLFLREEGMKYDPDIVLLAFCSANDVKGSLTARIYSLSKPLLRQGLGTPHTPGKKLEFANIPPPKPGETKQHMEFTGDSREIMAPLLGGMHELASEAGAHFMVASFGRFLNPTNPEIKQWTEETRDIVASLPNALFLDVDFEFWDRGLAEKDLVDESIDHDGHWDADGHKLVAEILLEFLGQENALD